MPLARRAFLAHLIDYAGLFPPAELDLEPALEAYREALAGPDAWMLERFIVPAGRLADVAALLGKDRPDPSGLGLAPLHLSVLGLPGPAFTAEATLALARETEASHAGALVCSRFELRLPPGLQASALAEALAEAEAAMTPGPDGARPRMALEVDILSEGSARRVGEVAEALAEANARAGRPAFALKVRCGGVTADAFPSPLALALAITAARQAGVPFKATAGLHHPFRHADPALGVSMHGFVNVFGGAVLAHVHGLDADALAQLLADEEPGHFRLGETLGWQSLEASAAEIADARDQFALSYGSCSFDEPRDDLRALGWL